MAYVKVETAKCINIYMPMKAVPLKFSLFRIYIRVGLRDMIGALCSLLGAYGLITTYEPRDYQKFWGLL